MGCCRGVVETGAWGRRRTRSSSAARRESSYKSRIDKPHLSKEDPSRPCLPEHEDITPKLLDLIGTAAALVRRRSNPSRLAPRSSQLQ
jgi:hypothetical protein